MMVFGLIEVVLRQRKPGLQIFGWCNVSTVFDHIKLGV
jgi:hypothetical protein